MAGVSSSGMEELAGVVLTLAAGTMMVLKTRFVVSWFSKQNPEIASADPDGALRSARVVGVVIVLCGIYFAAVWVHNKL